jgi:hypothetical protein
MTDIVELERRVTALEAAQNETAKTQTWMASTLGRIAAVQDGHTLRLERIEGDVAAIKADLSGVKSDLSGLRRELPGIIAEVMREVLKETKGGA